MKLDKMRFNIKITSSNGHLYKKPTQAAQQVYRLRKLSYMNKT